MNKRLIDTECPFCHHRFTMAKDTFLIASPSSGEYRSLKDGTFFTHVCSQCRQPFYLQYPLLYRDAQKNFRLALLPGKQNASSLPAGTVVTRDPAKFLKAFSILDNGLSIRETLPLFEVLRKRNGREWRILEYDKNKEILWFKCDDEVTGIRLSGKSFSTI